MVADPSKQSDKQGTRTVYILVSSSWNNASPATYELIRDRSALQTRLQQGHLENLVDSYEVNLDEGKCTRLSYKILCDIEQENTGAYRASSSLTRYLFRELKDRAKARSRQALELVRRLQDRIDEIDKRTGSR